MIPPDQFRLQCGADQLSLRGPRAVAELLADVARRIGSGPAIFAALTEHHRATSPILRSAGADRFRAHRGGATITSGPVEENCASVTFCAAIIRPPTGCVHPDTTEQEAVH